jgi:hypothetical protein
LPEEYKMEMEKATRYVETVRDTLGRDYPAKHDEFLDVLTDFRNNRYIRMRTMDGWMDRAIYYVVLHVVMY